MTRSSHRTERDTFGPIEVPADRLWGAQTQRSLEHFRISSEKMPRELIRALLLVKRAAARVNLELGALPERTRQGDHRRRRRGARRAARRRVSARRVADGVGHADEHERQRGARQPRVGDCSAARAAKRGSCIRTTTSIAASRRTMSFPTAMNVAAAEATVEGAAAGAARRSRATLSQKVEGRSRTSSRSAARICRTRRR